MPLDLDQLDTLANAASEWMPGSPWTLARHCFPATLGYVFGTENEVDPTPAAEAFQDAVTPEVLISLTQCARVALRFADSVRGIAEMPEPLGSPRSSAAAQCAWIKGELRDLLNDSGAALASVGVSGSAATKVETG